MWRNFRHFLYSATGSRGAGVVAEPDSDLERGLGGSIAARHEVDDPPCDQLRLTLDGPGRRVWRLFASRGACPTSSWLHFPTFARLIRISPLNLPDGRHDSIFSKISKVAAAGPGGRPIR